MSNDKCLKGKNLIAFWFVGTDCPTTDYAALTNGNNSVTFN